MNCLLSFYWELLYSEYVKIRRISLTYFSAKMEMPFGTRTLLSAFLSSSTEFCSQTHGTDTHFPDLNACNCSDEDQWSALNILISPQMQPICALLTPCIYLHSDHLLYWLNQVCFKKKIRFVCALPFNRIQGIMKINITSLNCHDIIYVKTVAGNTNFFPQSDLSLFL